MVKCNSPYVYCEKCIIDMDGMDSQGGIICCDTAEDLSFILEVKYMIKYRPHKGMLSESTKGEMEFDTIDQMYDYLLEYWNYLDKIFEREDLSVTKDFGRDERINWKELRYVCTKRFGKDIYDAPQCIGYCSIE